VQEAVGAGITVEQRGEATVDPPVQPMALPLGQTNPHRLNDLILNEVSITEPKLIVVA
jgi:hypothetical protein